MSLSKRCKTKSKFGEILIVAIATALVVVLLAVLASFVPMHLIGQHKSYPYQKTSIAINKLQMDLQMYGIANHRLPGPTYRDAIRALVDDDVDLSKKSHEAILIGRDAWHNPLIYEWRNEYEVVIRSTGANAIDENGFGDDIQRVIMVPRALRGRAATGS